ncbi:MAG TPA: metalloregulator ArsR/SmtB family transcription factor [Solirubrobacterales bacterium]
MRPNSESTGSGRRTATPGPFPPDLAERTAEYLRLVAEPTRIRLLAALNCGEASVQELAEAIGAPHQRTSKHLAVLRTAGMVTRRRQGPEARYSLVDWTGWWVVEQVAGALRPDDDSH